MKSIPVIAEEHILETFNKYADLKTLNVGLIIGQCTHQRNYIIHLAPTPNQADHLSVSSFNDEDFEIIGEHAKYVTRMLPGGLWVLGAYVISDNPLSINANNSKLKRLIQEVSLTKNQGFCNYGKYPSETHLIFHYNITSKQYSCHNLDNSNTFQPVDWKFQKTNLPWYQVNTDFSLDGTFLDTSKEISFHKQITNFLAQVSEKVNGLNVHLFGKEWEPSNPLEQIVKNKKIEENVIDVTLYQTPRKEGSSEVRIGESSAQLQVTGSIRSRICVHPRTTVEETATAIRQDIIRSLTTRLELHWDSLVGEENRAPEEGERVHEPPRRVLINPKSVNVFFSDYLYPGEGIDQAVKSCQELLDLQVDSENVIDDFEISADAGTVLSDVDITTESAPVLSKLSTSHIAAGAAFAILCLAFILNFYLA